MPGFAEFISSVRGGPEDKPDALTRARLATDKPDEPYDDDERQASLMARGYAPGATLDLNRRLAEKSAELASEREKIANGEKATARVRGMLERGQIGALDAHRIMDGDFGDANRAANLERQCANLQRQIGDAQALIAPAAERAPDQFASANRAAHELFTATTRQRQAEAQAGIRRSEPRPKEVSRSRGDAIRSEFCTWCTEFGVPDEQSYLLHLDGVPLTPPGSVPRAEQARQVRAEQERQAEHAERSDADLELYGRQVGIPYRPAGDGLAVR